MAYKDKSMRPRKGTGWRNLAEQKADYLGKRFGRLIIKEHIGLVNHVQRWLCVCDCGKEVSRRSESFKKNGDQSSCGCLGKEKSAKSGIKHGLHKSSEYQTYANMKSRCYNKNAQEFHRYGARGITVCDRWLESFENFIEDMGMKPVKGLSIDRINNDLGYFKENCRWATPREQANNFSRNRHFVHNGIRDTMANHCRRTGITKGAILHRVRKYGVTHEVALQDCLDYRIKEAA